MKSNSILKSQMLIFWNWTLTIVKASSWNTSLFMTNMVSKLGMRNKEKEEIRTKRKRLKFLWFDNCLHQWRWYEIFLCMVLLAQFIWFCILHLVAWWRFHLKQCPLSTFLTAIFAWSHSPICFHGHRKRNNSSTLWDKGGSSSRRFYVCAVFVVSSKPWKHWSYKTNQPSNRSKQAL